MAERLVCVGVHPQVLEEVARYKAQDDFLTNEMVEGTVDEIIEELHFLGALDKRSDKIHVSFESDPNIDPNQPYRVIRVKQPIYDDQYENIVGDSEETYMFRFDSENHN